MKPTNKKWSLAEPNWLLQYEIAEELGVSPVIAQILINRGLTSGSKARAFFNSSLSGLSSPWIIPGVKEAVQKISGAISNRDKILIYGDYDVDGVTSAALLVTVLSQLQADVSYYIPNRAEGYGINIPALEKISTEGFALVITVDCGISSVKEVAYGKSLGLEFIVTDHHEPGLHLPELDTVINPKLIQGNRELDCLAGVGVAFKLAQALNEHYGLLPEQGLIAGNFLDLVALGTIADVVPLIGENRILVKHGLKLLNQSNREGLRSLLEVAGLVDKDLTAGQVAFILAPRLNAAGRVSSAIPAVELLLTGSKQKGRELALLLDEKNQSRQIIEQQIFRQAMEMIEKERDLEQEQILVLASSFWHSGVLGIVASKLADTFHKPTILFALEGEQGKGSGRSIPGFNLYQAVKYCEDLLVKSGGHQQAVGLTIEPSKITDFRIKLNEYAAQKFDQDLLQPVIQLDAEILLEQLDFTFLKELESLKPYGHGNPEPVLAYRQARLIDCRGVGKEGKHLKLKISGENSVFEGIGFNLGGFVETAAALEEAVDVAFGVERNYWNGQEKLQLKVKDIKIHQASEAGLISPDHKNINDYKFQPVQLTGATSSCSDGVEQFDLLIKTIFSICNQKSRVLIVFPTKRILAAYYRLLADKLARFRIKCLRIDETNESIKELLGSAEKAADVCLAPEEILNQIIFEDKMQDFSNFQVVQVIFPKQKNDSSLNDKPEIIKIKFRKLQASTDYYFKRVALDRAAKLDYIKQLALTGSTPVYIYVNRRQEILDLYKDLKMILPDKRQKIWYYHYGLCFEQRQLVVNALNHGLAEIIISNELLELLGLDVEHRVLFDAPFSLEEFFLKGRLNKQKLTLHAIWQEGDLARNRLMLQTFFPQKKVIKELFESYNNLSTSGTDDDFSFEEAARKLRHYYAKLPPQTIKYFLGILDELKLNQYFYDQKHLLDLHSTWHFRQGETEKMAFLELQALLQGSDDQITQYLLEGVNE